MSRWLAPVLTLMLLIVATGAQAVSISMDPSDTFLGIGETVSIDLNISGLGDLSADSLGAWDTTIVYNASIIQLNSVTFGSELSVSFASVQFAGGPAGSVQLFEISLDSIADLDANQPAAFTIATLEFELINFGSSDIAATAITLSDAFGVALSLDSVTGATVGAVPEPSAAVLWMAGLLAVRSRIRKGRR